MSHTSKQLFKGSTLRLVKLVVSIGIGFYMLPFLVHALGDETYGIWVMAGSIVGFYALMDVGMGSALHRFLIRALQGGDEKEVNTVLSSAVFLFAGIGLASLGITLLIILMVPVFTDSEVYTRLFQLLIAILGIKTAVLFPLWRFYGVLIARYRYDIVSTVTLLMLILRATLIITIINNGYGIIAVAVITSLAELFECLAIIHYARKLAPQMRVAWTFLNLDKVKEYYHYGKYVFVSTAADKVRFSIDNFVVAGVIGIGMVTHYTIAITLIHYYGQIIESIFGVISPVFNKYHRQGQWDELRDVFMVATELTTLGAILIGGGLIVLGQPFISIWMGEGYSDTYYVLLILCVSGIVANSQTPSVAVLFAIAKHKFYAKITSIEALVNLSVSIILAQYIGIYGVAIGTTVPMLFNKLVLQPTYTCKQLGISIGSYYWLISRLFIVGAAFFVACYLFLHYVTVDSYLKLVIVGGLITVTYVVIAIRYVISTNTLKYIHGMMPDRLQFFVRAITRNAQQVF